MRYSESYKRAMVAKITSPGGPSATQLAGEIDASHSALSRWIKEYGGENGMSKSNGRSSKDWRAEDKLKAVNESSALSEEELGIYLRQKGLHSSDLERWKEEALEGVRVSSRGRPKKDPEVFELRKANQDLERELRRKEKALAETAALLVLQKKAQQIWGAKEEDV